MSQEFPVPRKTMTNQLHCVQIDSDHNLESGSDWGRHWKDNLNEKNNWKDKNKMMNLMMTMTIILEVMKLLLWNPLEQGIKLIEFAKTSNSIYKSGRSYYAFLIPYQFFFSYLGLTIVVLLFKDKECRQLNPLDPPRLKGNFLPLLSNVKWYFYVLN